MVKWLKVGGAVVVTLALVLILNSRAGMIPALGPFVNPISGFWQTAEPQHEPGAVWLRAEGLRDSVLVVFDDRRVPHIFARNDHDVYFAQGFVTAQDRLWQMDLQVRGAAGRLSEVLGEQTVALDRAERRRGMLWGAQNKIEAYQQQPELMEIIDAYTAGVNAFIGQLPRREIPLEFKLLGYKPEPFEPINVALMHMNMASTLAGGTSAVRMSHMRAALGDAFLDRFLPAHPVEMDPIIPPGTQWPAPSLTPGPAPDPFSPTLLSDAAGDLHRLPDPSLGSNSWAVHGSRTETGRPLLANDMHLEMTMPAIWYEVQLNAPGLNVYGVSIPGIPSVIVGFNEDVAWGVTNSGANVLDVYEVTFRDRSLTEYLHEGEWKPTRMVIEEIGVRGSAAVQDTVWYTHHGPVVVLDRDRLRGQASQWMAHRGTTDLRTFFTLNRARGYEDFTAALPYFETPAQNFTYADRHGNISLWHNGLFPLRWEGMGDFISDGSSAAYDWQAFVPRNEVPRITNPDRGFVSSANQNPAAPDYPYYLGRFFSSFERGARINERLAEMNNADWRDMQALQNDDLSLRAREGLPVMLDLLRSSDGFQNLSAPDLDLVEKLEAWDYEMKADEHAPVIFNEWLRQIRSNLWDIPLSGLLPQHRRVPEYIRTIQVLADPAEYAYIIDNFAPVPAAAPADLSALVMKSWDDAIAELTRRMGEERRLWRWWRYQQVRIMHLTRIEPLSRMSIRTDGATEAVNSMRGTNGPSWRMVVSLEDEIRAWGVYPGGQSGSPGSRHYDNFIEPWARGELFPLHFFRTPEEAMSWLQTARDNPTFPE
ncbi:MAG: penicillin acylase family protein [Balneolales bacterium]|nr:penicillin acylase family protein [Balneolales bacterium]